MLYAINGDGQEHVAPAPTPTAVVKKAPPADPFSQSLLDHFGALDADADGRITRADIGRAVGDPDVRGDLAAAVAALWLQGAFQEVDADRDKALTKAEISQYNRLREAWGQDPVVAEVEDFLRLRTRLEAAKNEVKELSERGSSALPPEEARVVADRLEQAVAERDLLQALHDERRPSARAGLVHYKAHLNLSAHSTTFFRDFREKIDCGTYARGTLFAAGAPQYTRFKQAKEGTCSLAAALVSLCHRRPEDVKGMVKERNGQLEVRFPGFPPVTVRPPTPAEIALYDHSGDTGLWTAAIYLGIGALVRRKKPGRYVCHPEATLALPQLEANDILPKRRGDDHSDGFNLPPPLRLLTGRPVKARLIWSIYHNPIIDWARDLARDTTDWRDLMTEEMTVEKMHEVLTTIMRTRAVATMGAEHDEVAQYGVKRKTARSWQYPHAYAVIGYTPDAKALGDGKVTLFDPWGKTERTTLQEAHDAFDRIAWEVH